MDLSKFIERLELWRKQRNLSIEKQKEGLVINILNEFGELGEAMRKKDIHGIIDSYLDILVFLINSIELDKLDKKYLSMALISADVDIIEVMVDEYPPITHAVIFISSTAATKHQALYKYIEGVYREIKFYGYDFELCLDEVMKALDYCKGRYDDTLKKFIKENSDKYEPDYKKARL